MVLTDKEGSWEGGLTLSGWGLWSQAKAMGECGEMEGGELGVERSAEQLLWLFGWLSTAVILTRVFSMTIQYSNQTGLITDTGVLDIPYDGYRSLRASSLPDALDM